MSGIRSHTLRVGMQEHLSLRESDSVCDAKLDGVRCLYVVMSQRVAAAMFPACCS